MEVSYASPLDARDLPSGSAAKRGQVRHHPHLDRPWAVSSRQTKDARGARRSLASAARDEGGYGVMQFVLTILTVLTGVLTWMFASAGLTRYRTLPGADWTELVPSIVAGLLTVLLAGMAIFATKVNRQRADVAARIAQSPDRPWLHVAQWDQGRIQDAPANQTAVAIGGFAAMWNAVVIGVALLARGRDDLRSDTTVLVFLGIFGLAGLGLIALTVYMALAARKFSPAVFEMSGVPGVLGGWLRGTIQIPPQVPEETEARVRLVCERKRSGSGPPTYEVWNEESSARTSSRMPVAFRIPFNLPESDLPEMPSKGTMRVSWLLSISASLPGVDYSAVFNVPVFPTEASDKTFVTGGESGAAGTGRLPSGTGTA
jgi:hypothetical protein